MASAAPMDVGASGANAPMGNLLTGDMQQQILNICHALVAHGLLCVPPGTQEIHMTSTTATGEISNLRSGVEAVVQRMTTAEGAIGAHNNR